MGTNPIAVAIPLFFVAIAAEWAVARARGRPVYRFVDAVTDLSCGVLQQVAAPWMAFLHGPYAALAGAAPLHLPPVAEHAVAFFGVDCAYYWWHRFTHTSNLGWGSHVVHHQSEDYNLAVALRQSLTSSLTSWPFYLPLALAGVSPEVGLLHVALNTLYQFWIHTELVDRLPGPIEAVFNTPSHHRVHHAVNPRYVDRNHAGVLIVWDRLFGTFEPESEPPVYGTVERFRSVDPLWANVWWFAQVAHDLRAAPSLAEAARLLVGPPSLRPSTLPPHPPPVPIAPGDQPKYDPPLRPGVAAWVVAQFALVAVGVEAVLLRADEAPGASALTALWVAATVASFGGWFERRAWVRVADPARGVLLGPVLLAWGTPWPAAVGAAVLAALLAVGFVGREPAQGDVAGSGPPE